MTDYPAAVQRRGPLSKLWPDRNAQAGVVLHSMEGYIGPALAELDDLTVPLSWHFSIDKAGTVYQHYDLEQSPWHAGSHAQNIRLIGVEHEGVAGEELTEPQFQASYALCVWIGQQSGWTPTRDPATRTLWEHHEVPGANTTCPNGRIPWYRYVPAPPVQPQIPAWAQQPINPGGDEDAMADRQEIVGGQDIVVIETVMTAALGRLVAGDESHGDEMFVRRGPSVDLPADEGEIIIRTKLTNIPATMASA